jgi:eukaryotic-like serine/threonine-protein kinase
VTLDCGARLGPYEIISLIGAGGMGEVYRARDARLEREVAVKILAPSLAASSDSLDRFEREARAAGTLNHPGIVSIYDIDPRAEHPYVVSELLEGETLRDRLRSGPLPPRKVIEFAVQIAQAIGAAHEKGIVHRDLKPENIFVTTEGRIKILDFGLAKLTSAEAEVKEATSIPTEAIRTLPGQLLGSVGYMAPEQVRGSATDARTDIFALGAVLYEMLTGARAFEAASPIETLSAILKDDPPPLPPAIPGSNPLLERVIVRCLEKNPEERFQSARDIAFALDTISSSSVVPGLAALGPVVTETLHATRLRIPTYHQVTFRRGHIRCARFAPEGETIVYGARWDGAPISLFASRRDSAESRPLDPPGADILSVSSSGELAISIGHHFVGGFISKGTLARVSLGGGAPREILEDVQEADWTPDGTQLAVVREVGGRHRIELPIDTVLFETSGWISSARVSPKGDRIAFIHHPLPYDDGGDLMTVDLQGNQQVISPGWSSAQGIAWLPSGKEIWFTAAARGNANSLFAVAVGGTPRVIDCVPGSLYLQDVSRDGHPLLTHQTSRLRVVALPPGEKTERDLSWLDWSRARALTADGSHLLFDETGQGAGDCYGVYYRKTDGSPAVRLGDGAADSLSPDGRWVIALTREGDSRAVLLPTRTGQSRSLDSGGVNPVAAHWFPDGKRILLCGYEEGRASRLYTWDPFHGKPEPFTPEGVVFRWDTITPDGSRVLARCADGAFLVYPIDGSDPTPVDSIESEDVPVRWSRDGQSLYLMQRKGLPARLERLDLATGGRDLVRELLPPDPTGIVAIVNVVITPDASVYAYTYARLLSDLYWMENVG